MDPSVIESVAAGAIKARRAAVEVRRPFQPHVPAVAADPADRDARVITVGWSEVGLAGHERERAPRMWGRQDDELGAAAPDRGRLRAIRVCEGEQVMV